MILAPSILTIKEEERNSYLNKLKDLGISVLHLDIMDGIFVPNTTLGVVLQEKIKDFDFIFDTHLMVNEPQEVIDEFIDAGSDIITFHLEAKCEIIPTINQIRSRGALCGISIKPNTPVSKIAPYLGIIDQILVMSVEPGFGGQKFMESALDKIKELVSLKNKYHYDFKIEVDGGIKQEHIKLLKDEGVDIIVMGTALTLSEDPKKLVDEVHRA